MTIRMKALRAIPYAGQRLQVGQLFDARGESDKRVLVAIKAAEVAPLLPPVPLAAAPAPAPAARVLSHTAPPADPLDVQAEASADAPSEMAVKTTVAAKRSYRRRDLTAEE